MNFFSFEQMGGDYPLLGGDLRSGMPVAAFGLADPQKYLIAALAARRAIYITADALTAQRAAGDIAALSKKRVALLAAKDEVLTYRKAGSKEALFRRLTALYEWQRGADVLVADVEALIQLVPARLPVFCLRVGEKCEMRALVDSLIGAGYTREYTIEGRGAFCVHGDILDIWPINLPHPVRIDFFDDEVEAVKPYDETTGERYPRVDDVEIVAATDVVLRAGEEERLAARLKEEVRASGSAGAYARLSKIADDIALDGYRSDFLLPILENSTGLLKTLSPDTMIVFDESKLIRDKLKGLYSEHFERFAVLEEGGECARFSKDQYVPAAEMEKFSGHPLVALQTFSGDVGFFAPMKLYTFHSSPARRYLNSMPDFLTDIRAWRTTGYRVLVFAGSSERADKLRDVLYDEGIQDMVCPDSLNALRGVSVIEAELSSGFLLHECKLAVIGTGDLFTKSPMKGRVKRRRGDFFVAPEVGDFAVHETYGIGRITGTKKIETTDGVKEYIALEYKGGDTLYVPVEQMDILSKYMGEDCPTLSKIGGGEFERIKARVKASLKKMAFDLKALYAERQEKKGYAFPPFSEEMEEFEAAFPYEETPDQLQSIEEIKADMCSGKVMDRLLCGDVGFGKTEVALRAAYLCILAGRQAALMCPSTVLSEQHFRTACERMDSFGVRVASLNRFRSEGEVRRILKDLAAGKIDLVIGTHRLLSDDVKFRDLGLLILDEEQRFGVEHKEKLKNIKRDVDCLTMTATPIPRTLHLSLSGIRDISTIRTPPNARLPVQTYVAEETETLLRDACIRELARKGQLFVLYNRVETIRTFAERLSAIVPEARIAVAHGRMDKLTLERNVFGFYRGDSDILVTTTIIENGIDLPNANTLIVIDADRLGISQLYQLRGRVGRGKRLAHAYFTYKPERVMTETAAERLKAIMQFTELGSGFRIAMRDLEIRGAGNVLGAEQHGHLEKVGYELYSKILREEITGEHTELVDLEIKATAFLPEEYIESNAGRMDCYKQIAEIGSAADYKRVCLSMEEIYGPIPAPALNLLIIALMKSYASRLGVKKISVGPKGGGLELKELAVLSSPAFQAALEKYADFCGLEMTSAPVIRFKPMGGSEKLMTLMTKFLKFTSTFH